MSVRKSRAPGNSYRGCPCGKGDHPVDSHLWDVHDVARAARRSESQVKADRGNPTCPLWSVGLGRGSKCLVWDYDEVKAYLTWVTARFEVVR